MAAGVDVRHWPADWQATDAADVVVAAFACQLPHAYMEAMAARERTPLWLNLDYLSAEDWIVGCHGLPSVKFQHVQKYFFPGVPAGHRWSAARARVAGTARAVSSQPGCAA